MKPEEIDVFALGSWNNWSRKLLSLPCSESQERFEANVRNARFVAAILLHHFLMTRQEKNGK